MKHYTVLFTFIASDGSNVIDSIQVKAATRAEAKKTAIRLLNQRPEFISYKIAEIYFS